MVKILTKTHSLEELSSKGGGKAKNLYLMTNEDLLYRHGFVSPRMSLLLLISITVLS